MSGRVILLFVLLVALLQCSSAASSPAQPREADALRQLLAKREKARLPGSRQELEAPAQSARPARRAHLSEDEREIMTKQIMQAISGMLRVRV